MEGKGRGVTREWIDGGELGRGYGSWRKESEGLSWVVGTSDIVLPVSSAGATRRGKAYHILKSAIRREDPERLPTFSKGMPSDLGDDRLGRGRVLELVYGESAELLSSGLCAGVSPLTGSPSRRSYPAHDLGKEARQLLPASFRQPPTAFQSD